MITKLCALVFVIVFSSSAGLAPAYAQEDKRAMEWKTFSIPQFGTSVDYPTTVYSQFRRENRKSASDNGFEPAMDVASFSIYSTANDAGETPVTYLRNNLRRPRSALQYERVTSSFFAISEETEDTIYYSRCNFSNNDRTIHCFDLIYPFRREAGVGPHCDPHQQVTASSTSLGFPRGAGAADVPGA